MLALLGALLAPAPSARGAPSGARSAGGSERVNPAAKALITRELGAGARVAYHHETGMVRFIGTAPGKPISRPAVLSPSASPTTVARAFLDRFGKAFGIADQARDLQVTAVARGPAGASVVRFQQIYNGVPVLGGELVVNLSRSGNMLSLDGEALPAPDVSVVPRVSASSARGTAITATAKSRGVAVSMLRAERPVLTVFDSRILGGPGLGRPTLVWRIDVIGLGNRAIDELVLVDARLGAVVLHFNQVETAQYREVCDASNTSTQVPCTTPVRTEGGAPVALQDVNNAYDYMGDVFTFFNALGRDSIDGAGMHLVSTVRFCDPSYSCPYQNAYWNGQQMVFGQGYASADDVVGHEMSHGVTDFTSHLFYFYQSGAINESLSDTFGEFIDLTNGKGTDTAAVRWLMGEDLPGGAIRSMQDPTLYNDPDKTTSPNYYGGTGDNGGVHYNSGVNNKAAYLITDGGTFNGKTVTGIGIAKASKIYYEADAHLLTSAADYGDLYTGLQQACTNLVGTGGITGADCTSVTNAVQAVEMNVVPPAAPNPEAPVCAAGQTAQNLFIDNLENPASGNWVTQTISGANEWYYPQNPNPYGFDATYATSGTTNFWGYDQSLTGDFAIALNKNVAIPAGSTAYLRFNHAYMFEFGSVPYDGGVLEYSTDAGASWHDAGALLSDNGYTGTISPSYGNPLGGRSAFARVSNGYISSRANLSTLAGQNVRFRFRIGTDVSGWYYGWFVDDVRVYTCSASAVPAVSAVSPRAGSTAGGNTVTITGTKFVSGATAKFGPTGTALPTTFVSATQLRVTAPAHAAGTVDVYVTTPGGTSAATNGDLYAFGVPSVTALAPKAGPTAGGTLVTITGSGFVPGAKARFSPAGTLVATTFVSPTQVKATSPAHAAGTVHVYVVTAAGTSAATSADYYAYGAPTITALSPRAGSTAGGTLVTISGSGFVSGATAKFGPTGTALTTTFVSPNQLKVTTPAHAAGTLHVYVTTAGGTSTATNADYYAFGKPGITAISPKVGPVAGGTLVTITGTGFVPGAKAKFGATGTVLATTFVSPTQVKVTTPAHAAGPVHLFAMTGGGTSTATAADVFAFQ